MIEGRKHTSGGEEIGGSLGGNHQASEDYHKARDKYHLLTPLNVILISSENCDREIPLTSCHMIISYWHAYNG